MTLSNFPTTDRNSLPEPSSFRDPSGFVFVRDGEIYRQVNRSYQEHFDCLMDSGLYDELVENNLLISHCEVDIDQADRENAYKILRPAPVRFISYPYEWSFSELKDAALLTLEIERRALARGMSLKDASSFNVQLENGRPIFIDTLSFERYEEGEPWIAYRQFCQHFLAPLALMSHVDVRMLALLRPYLDGIPLDLASKLLPLRTWTAPGLVAHLHLHARAQRHYADQANPPRRFNISRTARLGLVDNLKSTIEHLKWRPAGTEWSDYYFHSPYEQSALEEKEKLVASLLDRITPTPAMVWDLGANTGRFSRISSRQGILTVSFDIDPAAVEKNYLEMRTKGETNLLPLVVDLTKPSAGKGWENRERRSLIDRARADVVLALALVHHLAISGNLPLSKIFHFLSIISNWVIIEFIPKEDGQVQRLLSSRRDIFTDYNADSFERELSRYFEIQHRAIIRGTDRALYLLRRIVQ